MMRSALFVFFACPACALFPSFDSILQSSATDAASATDGGTETEPSDGAMILADSPTNTDALRPMGDGAIGAVVYADSLAAGWTDGTWLSTVDYAATSPVFSGNRSIAWQVTAAFGGFFPYYSESFDASQFHYFSFEMRASAAVSSFSLVANFGASEGAKVSLADYGGLPPVGTWKHYKIPLSDLGAERAIVGIEIQDYAGKAEPIVYIDQIEFLP